MARRYHKSVKLGSNTKINFNKKSISISTGGKSGRVTSNLFKGTVTASYKTPIKGVSYSKTFSTHTKAPKKNAKASEHAKVSISRNSSSTPVVQPTAAPMPKKKIHSIKSRPTPKKKIYSSKEYSAYSKIIIGCGILITIMGSLLLLAGIPIPLILGIALIIMGIHYQKKAVLFKEKEPFLISWQNFLIPESGDKLILSENDLKAATAEQAANAVRIAQDSYDIVKDTTSVETFFGRFDLLNEKLQNLVSLEQYLTFEKSPSELYAEFHSESQQLIRYFISRAFAKVYDSADELKTERGKNNRYQKFFDSLQAYDAYLDQETKKYITKMQNEHIVQK